MRKFVVFLLLAAVGLYAYQQWSGKGTFWPLLAKDTAAVVQKDARGVLSAQTVGDDKPLTLNDPSGQNVTPGQATVYCSRIASSKCAIDGNYLPVVPGLAAQSQKYAGIGLTALVLILFLLLLAKMSSGRNRRFSSSTE